MYDCKPVTMPFEKKLSKEMSASMPEEIDKMKNIPYQSADVCNAGNLT
jgi:hypothetical protein